MPMRKLFVIIFALPLLLCSCSNEVDILPEQQRKMVAFLTGTHDPRLAAKADLDPESQLPYFTSAGKTAYRYIHEVYNPNRENWTKVTSSSKVTISFRAYVFTFSSIIDVVFSPLATTVTLPYYSNDPAMEQLYYSELVGLTPGLWTFEPLVIDMRNPGILKGLSVALLEHDGDVCRQGDKVEAYMTYNMAYGDKEYLYNIPKETPLAFFFTIDNVE